MVKTRQLTEAEKKQISARINEAISHGNYETVPGIFSTVNGDAKTSSPAAPANDMDSEIKKLKEQIDKLGL
jgi:hypothetical protein